MLLLPPPDDRLPAGFLEQRHQPLHMVAEVAMLGAAAPWLDGSEDLTNRSVDMAGSTLGCVSPARFLRVLFGKVRHDQLHLGMKPRVLA